jgi:hypothetical protein
MGARLEEGLGRSKVQLSTTCAADSSSMVDTSANCQSLNVILYLNCSKTQNRSNDDTKLAKCWEAKVKLNTHGLEQ